MRIPSALEEIVPAGFRPECIGCRFLRHLEGDDFDGLEDQRCSHREGRRGRQQHTADSWHAPAAAITHPVAGTEKLWAGTVKIEPNAKTGAHHHGELESVIYVVRGRARMRWGDDLEYVAEADAGDFIYVPPFVPHQEINANPAEPRECVLVRSGQDPIVVNLDIAPAEPPEEVRWTGPNHP